MSKIVVGGFAASLLLVLLVPVTACDLVNECATGTLPTCAGPTSITTCDSGNEGEGNKSFTDDCPPEQVCMQDPTTSVPSAICSARSVGGACRSDRGCLDSLLCDNGTCVAPAQNEIALCNAAPVIQLPANGAIDLDFAVGTDAIALAERIARPACEEASQPVPVPSFGRAGIVQVQRPPTGGAVLHVDGPDGGPLDPSIFAIGQTLCTSLYGIDTFRDQCTVLTQPGREVLIPANTPSFALIMTLAPGATASTVRVRFTVEEWQ